ncbi:MAG TPA: hypothetical protein VFQ38_08935 [Longimicrobiales bacterium]|nr:hypothetical protein [Longimicrobiales bacterium]
MTALLPLPAMPLPVELRDAAAGTFGLRLPGGRELALVLRAEGERLLAQAPGQPALPLVYLGEGTFGAAFDATLRLRLVSEVGRIIGVVLQQAGHTLEGSRQD